MAQALQYQAAWETKLAERLDKSQNWKEVCDVIYTDTQTTNLPYIGVSGEPAVTTAIFGAAADRSTLSNVITFTPVTQSNDTLVVVSTDYEAVYIDYADQAQSEYARFVDLGDLLGKKIGERVESLVLGNYANWTAMGDNGSGVPALSSTPFAVSATNIDDMIRGIIQQIQTANGFDLMRENGAFTVWRPADWNLLISFMQANGFRTADEALARGADSDRATVGIPYMEMFHYVSTLFTAGHLMCGVRGIQKLGLLKSTFGKTYTAEMPPSSTAGMLSGTGIHTRLDYGLKVQTNVLPIIFNFNVQ
jgi:hypothetical protein